MLNGRLTTNPIKEGMGLSQSLLLPVALPTGKVVQLRINDSSMSAVARSLVVGDKVFFEPYSSDPDESVYAVDTLFVNSTLVTKALLDQSMDFFSKVLNDFALCQEPTVGNFVEISLDDDEDCFDVLLSELINETNP